MTEDNFIAKFKDRIAIDSVSFIKIWTHYDHDGSDKLERGEFEKFIRDLLAAGDEPVTDELVDEYIEATLETFDINETGKIELSELASMLPLEDNFLAQFNGRERLSEDEVHKIFSHYDADGNGFVRGDEMLALLHDTLRREGRAATKTELDCYVTMTLTLFDADVDGQLRLSELERMLSSH